MFTYYIIFLRKWACTRAFLRMFHIYKNILFRLSTIGYNCRIAIFPILMYFKNFILYVIFDSSPNNLLGSLFYNTYTLSIYAAFKATTFDLLFAICVKSGAKIESISVTAIAIHGAMSVAFIF